MSENKLLKKAAASGKKLAVFLVSLAVIGFVVVFGTGFLHGDEAVEFRTLQENEIPQEIVSQVIPEYRGLERALACMVDGKVYVMVSRGEKPTSGFDIAVDKIVMEEKEGESCIAVYANFTDPEPGVALTQILTYPLQVVETGLTAMPDRIELRVQY